LRIAVVKDGMTDVQLPLEGFFENAKFTAITKSVTCMSGLVEAFDWCD